MQGGKPGKTTNWHRQEPSSFREKSVNAPSAPTVHVKRADIPVCDNGGFRMFRSFVVALALAASPAPTLYAQMTSGAIRGTAVDPDGAAIPDVVVTLTSHE